MTSDEVFMLHTLNAVRVMMKNRDRSVQEELIYDAVRQCAEMLECRMVEPLSQEKRP